MRVTSYTRETRTASHLNRYSVLVGEFYAPVSVAILNTEASIIAASTMAVTLIWRRRKAQEMGCRFRAYH